MDDDDPGPGVDSEPLVIYGNEPTDLTLLEQMDQMLNSCAICMDKTSDVVLKPCGHISICALCALKLFEEGTRVCPMCRAGVDAVSYVDQRVMDTIGSFHVTRSETALFRTTRARRKLLSTHSRRAQSFR